MRISKDRGPEKRCSNSMGVQKTGVSANELRTPSVEAKDTSAQELEDGGGAAPEAAERNKTGLQRSAGAAPAAPSLRLRPHTLQLRPHTTQLRPPLQAWVPAAGARSLRHGPPRGKDQGSGRVWTLHARQPPTTSRGLGSKEREAGEVDAVPRSRSSAASNFKLVAGVS